MKKALFLLLLVSIIRMNFCYAQISNEHKNEFFKHVRYGGSIGASFGKGYFSASISPKAVYDFNEYFSVGTGILTAYSNSSNYSSFVYGGSILGFFRPIRALQLSLEFEELHVSRKIENYNSKAETKYWYPAIFMGIGYRNGPITIGIRYDLLFNEEKSMYGNALIPFISLYF